MRKDEGLTKIVGSYIEKVKFEEIPKDIVRIIKDSVIDTIGCGILGSTMPHSRLLMDCVMEWGSIGESVIWGTDKKAAVPFAATANCMSVHASDFDDTVYPGGGHRGSVTVPAAMAIAEKRGDITGRQFLTAIVAGYEISNLIGWSLDYREFVKSGFYNSVPAIFGTATVAGKLMGLDEEKLIGTMGVAATQAAGLYSGTVVKRLNAPKAVMNGIFAADLAAKGLEVVTDALEAKYSGFFTTFAPGEPLWDVIPDNIGKYRFKVYQKYYPCIRSNQPAVETVKVMMDEHPDIKPDVVKRIVVHADTATIIYTADTTGGWKKVDTIGNALISLPYCVAAMIVDGELTLDQFAEEKIKNPKIQELLRKIEAVADPEIDKLPITERYRCTVDIELTNGKTYSKFYSELKGNPTNPMTKEELYNKFKKNANRAFKMDRIEKLLEILERLEELDDVREIAPLLST